jgi:hypothetical protein
MAFFVGSPGSKGVRAILALWRRQYGLGVSRRVPLARTPPVFSRGYYRLYVYRRQAGGILERFVDFWEVVVEWGFGLSYNSRFSILQFLHFFRFWSPASPPYLYTMEWPPRPPHEWR